MCMQKNPKIHDTKAKDIEDFDQTDISETFY